MGVCIMYMCQRAFKYCNTHTHTHGSKESSINQYPLLSLCRHNKLVARVPRERVWCILSVLSNGNSRCLAGNASMELAGIR